MHAKLFWIFLKSNGLFIKQTDAAMRFLISIPLTALCLQLYMGVCLVSLKGNMIKMGPV